MRLGVSNVAGISYWNQNLVSISKYYQNYVRQKTKEAGQSDKIDFGSALSAKKAESAGQEQGVAGTGTSKTDAYLDYLKSKYGNVTVKSVGKDQQSLDRISKSMRGNDVVIAPNIVEEMANDPQKAAYYEGKIDDFFNNIPISTARCAAKGLVYEPGGVVIHEDGSVTYISGCSDSPERVAEVNAINKAKREKEAARRKESLERSQEAADQHRKIIEDYNQKQAMSEALRNRLHFTGKTDVIEVSQQIAASAFAAYDKGIMEVTGNSGNNII